VERLLYCNVISLMLTILDQVVEGMSMNLAGVRRRGRAGQHWAAQHSVAQRSITSRQAGREGRAAQHKAAQRSIA
jgi:hypothetical protein